jgi:[protein-PII] uridylyltransferase
VDTDNNTLNWLVTRTLEPKTRNITIAAKDAPDLFSKIAGALTLNGFDILSARKYRQQDDTIDILKVRPSNGGMPEEKDVEAGLTRTESVLRAALSGESDISGMLRQKIRAYRALKTRRAEKPAEVAVDNNISSISSIIKVTTDDFPGLLFLITDAFFRCGLDVHIAKVSTKDDQVEDIFYVRDTGGQKMVSSEQVSALKAALNKALAETDPKNNLHEIFGSHAE